MKTQPLTRGLRTVLGGGGNSTYFLHGEDAWIIDVKFGDFARRLRSEVETERLQTVKRILLTHSHSDHAGGLALYPSVGAVMVHPKTLERLRAKEVAPKPWVTVEKDIRLLLGGEEVRVMHLGKGHTDGDLIAWFPKEKVLVAGDVFSNGFEPSVDESAGGDMLSLRGTVEALLSLPFEKVVPGHGELAGRTEVTALKEYLARLESDVRLLLSQGRTEDEVVKSLVAQPSPYRAIPFGADRERSVRLMYQAIVRTLPPTPGVPR
jgi:cyclase